MTTFDWLMMFHITGAFLLVGGAVAAGVLNTLALRAQRPSEAALYLRLVRRTLPPIFAGTILTLVFGLWLVANRSNVKLGSFWVVAALVLWVVLNALGGMGGRHQEKARELAERLGAAGDTSNDELTALLHDRRGNALSWLAGAATLLLLVDMIWKP
ncbi:MAG TPA: DUF2269 family protein [Gaiellaceae bacterium]|nr:DUF2269 family protein [Gaiellaceae bacterium]